MLLGENWKAQNYKSFLSLSFAMGANSISWRHGIPNQNETEIEKNSLGKTLPLGKHFYLGSLAWTEEMQFIPGLYQGDATLSVGERGRREEGKSQGKQPCQEWEE